MTTGRIFAVALLRAPKIVRFLRQSFDNRTPATHSILGTFDVLSGSVGRLMQPSNNDRIVRRSTTMRVGARSASSILALLGGIALAACSGAYKQAVERRVSTLPQENLRVYKACVLQSCSVMIAELAMQQVISNAQLACLVDTDKGVKEADSPACECAHAASDQAIRAACEHWMGYVAPAPPASSAAGSTLPGSK